MPKLMSEQLPNDGGYHIKRLVNEANARLKEIGKQGKRATIVAKKSSLSLQFTFKDGNGRAQKNVGLGGIPVSAKGIEEAEKIAQLVTSQLVANQFNWDWFNGLIGKDTVSQKQVLTCKEMVERYKKHYFKQRQKNKNPEGSWYINSRHLESILGNLNKPLSLSLIRQIIEKTENNTDGRRYTLNGLVNFLRYFDNNDYKNIIKDYKTNNKVKRKKRNVPSDKKISEIYKTGFIPESKCSINKLDCYPKWQFLYGLLATYGLRIHEAWHIANWDKPVVLKNEEWIAIDIDNENTIEMQNKEDTIIPAILDPENTEHLLCISHQTKTGYRIAIPLSPEGHDWIKEFNLLQPLNLPKVKNPLERTGTAKLLFKCTNVTVRWFQRKKYGFSAHALRHAYNHRGHFQEFNPKVLADSLGHSIQMNSNNYLSHMNDDTKLQGMLSAIDKNREKQSRIKSLEEENKTLKAKIKELETELKMYQAISQT